MLVSNEPSRIHIGKIDMEGQQEQQNKKHVRLSKKNMKHETCSNHLWEKPMAFVRSVKVTNGPRKTLGEVRLFWFICCCASRLLFVKEKEGDRM